MNRIKLDKEDLYLVANENDLYFEYQGKKVATMNNKGTIKTLEKLPRGYKAEMQNFVWGILDGTTNIFVGF